MIISISMLSLFSLTGKIVLLLEDLFDLSQISVDLKHGHLRKLEKILLFRLLQCDRALTARDYPTYQPDRPEERGAARYL